MKIVKYNICNTPIRGLNTYKETYNLIKKVMPYVYINICADIHIFNLKKLKHFLLYNAGCVH